MPCSGNVLDVLLVIYTVFIIGMAIGFFLGVHHRSNT